MNTKCGDCGVAVGEMHNTGCDIERCVSCGGQRISCDCSDWIDSPHSDMVWTGEFPGKEECRELGFWCYWHADKGWVECDKSHPEARENLNRLCSPECKWDMATHRWELA